MREQVWHFAPGPTWFLEALLVFSLSYTLWRALRRDVRPPVWRRLRGAEVAAVVLPIAVTAFAAHLAFPIKSGRRCRGPLRGRLGTGTPPRAR